ncbi:class I SAM-dependent RNA methyltransferase [Glacieibacterium sp.]|uniref:class I SAM-dependent RNA methyltransferase n=1 Tax=Glacieibacterium sp. TaxID=2860237 RepID=UPI003B004A39
MSEIVRIGARGDGVTDDGRFIAFGVPGDRVEPDGTLIPGPDHQVPPCRHFPECGGCQLQHVADPAYARWALARIEHALAGIPIGSIQPVHLSPPRTRRRASLHAVKRGQTVLGFASEASHRIIDLHECHVLLPELFALVAPLRALLGKAMKDGQGAGVTLAATDSGIDVLLSNVAANSLPEIERLTRFAAAHGLARLSVENEGGVETMALASEPVMHFGGVPVAMPPAAFLQATRDGEAALVAAVLAATAGAGKVADLFCGLGTFSLPLAAHAKVLAVDGGGPATVALQSAARLAGKLLLTEHRDLFRRPLLPAELDRFDALVFDPPRAGAAAQVEQIALSKVPIVVAVSCNPSTFSRDARVLVEAGYRIGRIWPVGQFRWSTHLELVAEFRR